MGSLEIQFSTFQEIFDSGLYIDKECILLLSNCIFSKCIASSDGGGLFLAKGSSNLKSICFVDCKGSYGSSIFINSNKNHNLYEISCFRCFYEETSGDSVDFRQGKYQIDYLNSTFSKSSQAAALQFASTLQCNISYFLGVGTEGINLIELNSLQHTVTLQYSGLINNTASSATIYVNGLNSKGLFKKFVFAGNKIAKCFTEMTNTYFEDCVYLDKGPFGTNPLPSGVRTNGAQTHIEGKFVEIWCNTKIGIAQSTEGKTILQHFLKIFSFIPFFE